MAEQFTFPQSGDADDAENFASMIGQANLSDYVESGLNLQNYNAAGPDIDVTTGKCFISETSATASSSGDTILRTNNVVQIPATNALSLTDSAVNEIYVDGDLGVDDNGTVNATTGGVPAGALKIGEVDTTNDTVTEVNRDPTYIVDEITVNDEIISSTLASFSGTIDLDGTTNVNSTLNITSGDIDLEGTGADTLITLDDTHDLTIQDDAGTDIFTFLESGGVSIDSGDLIDGASNVIFDQSNNWVPDAIIEQNSLDAVTFKGNDLDSNGDGKVDSADNADNASLLGGNSSSFYEITGVNESGSANLSDGEGPTQIFNGSYSNLIIQRLALSESGASSSGGADFDITVSYSGASNNTYSVNTVNEETVEFNTSQVYENGAKITGITIDATNQDVSDTTFVSATVQGVNQ